MPVIPSATDALRIWNLLNLDTFELFRGQFHAEGLTHGGVGGVYTQKWSLNRAHPIIQFVHGESETYSFTGRLYAARSVEEAETQLETLKLWARRDETFERPPVLEFWAGNGHAFFTTCVLESLSDITYQRPTALGAVRQVTFTVNLREYKEYSLDGPVIGDTRYHRTRQGDYFELVAIREYGDAKYGDVVRKRHPKTANPQIGDVIELPHISKIRREKVEPKSVPLKDAFSRKSTVARTLRLAVLERHFADYVSHILRAAMAYDDLAPKYVLQVAGSELGTGITKFIDQVEYESADGMADMARITVNDPGGMLGDLKVFKPGGELDIWMGYGPNVEHVGRVLLRRHKHHFSADGEPTFNIEGYTLDALMMDNSPEEGKKRRFPDMKMSDIVEEVALAYGFGELDIDETSDEPKSLRSRWQKSGVSDYQVIKGLANITGFYFWVDYLPEGSGWTLHFKSPEGVVEAVDQPNYTFRYNDGDYTTLLDFHPELVLQGATTKLKIVFKDPKTGKRVVEEVEEENESPDIAFTGNEQEVSEDETAKPTEIKVFLGEYSFDLQPKRFVTSAEALAWARQWFRRNRENMILGSGTLVGVETLRARQFHTLENLNNTFSGKYYFSKVRHVMSASDGYMCSFNARKQESLT